MMVRSISEFIFAATRAGLLLRAFSASASMYSSIDLCMVNGDCKSFFRRPARPMAVNCANTFCTSLPIAGSQVNRP